MAREMAYTAIRLGAERARARPGQPVLRTRRGVGARAETRAGHRGQVAAAIAGSSSR